MPVFVALLRGVNVGGRTVLPMVELRQLAADLGYEDVRTYIQSGNLLLRAKGKAPTVARALEGALAARGSVEPTVHVRTREELERVVEGSPFLSRGVDPSKLHVVFTAATGTADPGLTDLERYAPEEVVAVGQELHLHLPNGVGRSKLVEDLVRRGGGARGTIRNWRTVTKLVELARGLG